MSKLVATLSVLCVTLASCGFLEGWSVAAEAPDGPPPPGDVAVAVGEAVTGNLTPIVAVVGAAVSWVLGKFVYKKVKARRNGGGSSTT